MALVKGITMNTKDKIYVAVHTGMVGSAIVREFIMHNLGGNAEYNFVLFI